MIMGVPYDAEVEYLESTGTEYIDTKVMPDYTLTATFDVEVLPTTTLIRFSGSRVGENPSFMFSLSENAGLINDYGSGILLSDIGNRLQLSYFKPSIHIGRLSLEFGNRYIKDLSTGQTLISGSTVGPTSTGLPHRPMLLWALQDDTNVLTGSIGRIYGVKYFQNNVLVRDFIPVRVGSVGYMYDRVSKKLFGNQGTGSFILGPDVAKPVMGIWRYRDNYFASDYIRDGLVAMWDSIENVGWGVHDSNSTMWKDLVGNNDLTLVLSPSLYFTDTYLYASNEQFAAGDVSKIPTNLNNVTFEACWNRVTGFANTYDSAQSYGQMVLDVVEYKLWYKCSLTNTGWMNTPPSGVMQGVPFTQAMICQYGGSANTIIPFVNGTQISNTNPWTNNPQINRIQIGSGYGGPTSRHHCIRVYGRALAAKEIAYNYMIDKARFNLP